MHSINSICTFYSQCIPIELCTMQSVSNPKVRELYHTKYVQHTIVAYENILVFISIWRWKTADQKPLEPCMVYIETKIGHILNVVWQFWEYFETAWFFAFNAYSVLSNTFLLYRLVWLSWQRNKLKIKLSNPFYLSFKCVPSSIISVFIRFVAFTAKTFILPCHTIPYSTVPYTLTTKKYHAYELISSNTWLNGSTKGKNIG